jgi:hypothetical protein
MNDMLLLGDTAEWTAEGILGTKGKTFDAFMTTARKCMVNVDLATGVMTARN